MDMDACLASGVRLPPMISISMEFNKLSENILFRV